MSSFAMNATDSLDFHILPQPDFPDHATWKTFEFLGGLYLVWGSVSSQDGREAFGILRYDAMTANWAPVWQKTLGRDATGSSIEGARDVDLQTVTLGAELLVRIGAPRQQIVLRSSNGAFFTEDDLEAWPTREAPHPAVVHGQWQVRCREGLLEKARASSDSWDALPQLGSAQASVAFALPFGNAILVGADDATLGSRVDLLQLDAAGEPSWQSVFERGAGLYTFAARLIGWVPLDGRCYLITAPLADRDSGPGIGFNLLEIAADGAWELLVGPPRVTPSGFRVPLTGRGAGLDEFQPGSAEFFIAQNGQLLLGTINVLEGLRMLGSRDGVEWEILSGAELAGYQPVSEAHWLESNDRCWVVMATDNLAHGRQVRVAEIIRQD